MPRLPEEILGLIDDVLEKAQELNKEIKEEEPEIPKDFKWDVPLDLPIEFFDANLSYELSGYRPINATLSLDFNPDWFTEARDTYNRTGHYTEFRNGTKAFRDFWIEQYKRCKYGYTVNGYTLTGDHYFFLNFYQLKDLDNVTEAGGGRQTIFPNFLEGQYEWFHYLKLARKLKLNACMMKARSAGFSEIESALLANSYNCIKGSINVACAYAANLLDKLLEKVWASLTFLNNCTDGGFFKSRLAADSQYLKRASLYRMINNQKVETGWMSLIQGVIVDRPGKLRGDRTDVLVMEECFGKDTEVIMYDYSTKYIQDILVGDFVLGLDGTPLEVMCICSGIDLMYKVHLKRGLDYVINSKHKLYLERRPRTNGYPDFTTLMTVLEYLNLPKYHKKTTYGKTNGPIQYKEDKCDLDPYYLGLWLGDGFSESPARIVINKESDIEIYNYVIELHKKYQLETKETICDNCSKCVRLYGSKNSGKYNILNKLYNKYNLINNKHIPNEVYFSTLEYRLLVLAGIIDTDGNINKNRSYEIGMSKQHLILQIGLLALTCGFDICYSLRVAKSGYGKGCESYRVNINGEVNRIPVRIKRKICTNIRFNTTNSTPITIENIGEDEYYGITLKSYGKELDSLFLLKDFTIVHNCGLWPGLTKAYTMADALVGLIGHLWGLRVVGGTGGETGGLLEGLRKMYYNPKLFGILPYRHNFTQTGEETISAFFLPAFRTIKDLNVLDKRGWISDEDGKKEFDRTRNLKLSDAQEYATYCAEYCYNAEEAFSLEGNNKFNKINIAEQLTQIRALKRCPPIEKGFVEYLYKGGVHSPENITGFKWVPDLDSPIQILEHPIWTLSEKFDEEGNITWRPPKEPIHDLYVIGIDGIDIGSQQTSQFTDHPSDFCLTVLRRAYGLQEPQFVALYKDRPRDVRECYKIAIKLALYYNAIINIEATRQGIIPYARERKLLKLFMRRPRATLSDQARNNNKQFGTPATVAIIDHLTDLIADYVEDYCHLIWFDEMLDELNRYTNERKTNFDIVAAVAMALLADEELQGVAPRIFEKVADEWLDIGYYIDYDGKKRYGVIPNLKPLIIANNNFELLYDDTGPRTSDPRVYSRYLS